MEQSQNAAFFSLNMNNILFYIIFSGHNSFVSMLNCQMIQNIRELYTNFQDVVHSLNILEDMIRKQNLPYRSYKHLTRTLCPMSPVTWH